MPELEVITIKTKSLIPYEQFPQIIESIQKFGFVIPIIIDENRVVIAGHSRLFAALKLGLKEVPAICIANLSETQRKELIIADTKQLTQNAGHSDEEKLKNITINPLRNNPSRKKKV
jgi:ParB-like chromosome segregation protein Spo0J